MWDRYGIRMAEGGWAVTRTDTDVDFGFTKYVGLFQTKRLAKLARTKIKNHEDMNFAEWFYPQKLCYENPLLKQETLAKHLYKLWRAIGGHLTVDAKRDIMEAQLVMLAYVIYAYEGKIEDLEMEMAMEAAGEDW